MIDLFSTNITKESLIRGRFPITLTLECTRKTDGTHFHNYTQMWYMLSGTMEHTIDGVRHKQTPGSLTVVPPYTKHNIDTAKSDDTPVYVSISFTDSFLTDSGYRYFSFTNSRVRFEEREIPEFSELSGSKREIGDMLARRMHAEFSKHYDMDYNILRELLVEFIKLFCITESNSVDITLSRERANAIAKAVSYISQHCTEKITIDMLCKISAMSRRVFTKSFKIVTGLTVVEFITSLRLDLARNYILFSQKSGSEIAELCGFCDKAHLSRVFSSKHKMSPTEFKKRNLPNAIIMDREQAQRWDWLKEKHTKQ